MKVVKIKGGIGNQLFQYAFARSLQEKYTDQTVLLDNSYFNTFVNDINNFSLEKIHSQVGIADQVTRNEVQFFNKENLAPNTKYYKGLLVIEGLFNPKYFFEKTRDFIGKNLNEYEYFDGYWQSELYFNNIRSQLLNEINVETLSDKTSAFIEKIKQKNSVFLSVRRPYSFETKHMKKNLTKVSENLNYFKSALNKIKSEVDNPLFVVFSNDIEWVKENVDLSSEVIFRNNDDVVSDIEELMIMKSCKHAIISNSTFSWWGAWLINNKNKIIIAPKKWQQDYESTIIPESWIRL